MDDKRADPDALLNSIKSNKLGHLTAFLGAAAGVGKTYAMLEASQEHRQEGTDIVVGWVETHGRRETQKLLTGLPIIPARNIEYRERTFKEMDLDAILIRKPEIVIVDELAHSNIPGSRHIKRYQDVEEILRAGIDVYTTINIQHMESLNDIVAKITGVIVQETIPDKFLEKAEIKLIDIPSEELIQRLSEGKVYVSGQAAEASRKFFRPGNINALREMSLRYTAQRVDQQMETYMHAHAIEGPWAAGERVMVCISSSPFAAQLVRAGQRMAMRLKADWIVVYVEKPDSMLGSINSRDCLYSNIHLAEELGAEVVATSGIDVAREILNIVRQRNVTQIIIGKPLRPRLQEWLRGSIVDQVIRHSEGINVHIIPGQAVNPPGGNTNRKIAAPRSWRNYIPYLLVILMVFLLTIILRPFSDQLGLVNIAMIFLLPVLFSAVTWQRSAAWLAAALGIVAFDFFFVPPVSSLTVSDLRYIISFIIIIIVASVTSSMSTRVRQQVEYAHQRETMMADLYDLSREFGAVANLDDILKTVIRKAENIGKGDALVFLPDEKGKLSVLASSKGKQDGIMEESELAVAAWTYENNKVAGPGTDTLPGAKLIYIPMSTQKATIGVLGLEPPNRGHNFWLSKKQFIEAFANLTAAAINRVQLAEEARQAQLNAESERLRTALFNSLSHDLRTPLTSIIAGVTGLLDEEELYDADARRALLENIRQGAVRMHRLLTNLLDMARLKSGYLQLNREWCDIQDIIGVAVQRCESGEKFSIKIDIASGLPLVLADFVLVEQVIVNILDNAIKYGGSGLILIKALKQEEYILVSTADQGTGIPEDELVKIFDPFYRLQKVQEVAGTGLGLAICRSIIEAHEGEIWAEQQPECGTKISFTLPMADCQHDKPIKMGEELVGDKDGI